MARSKAPWSYAHRTVTELAKVTVNCPTVTAFIQVSDLGLAFYLFVFYPPFFFLSLPVSLPSLSSQTQIEILGILCSVKVDACRTHYTLYPSDLEE